MISSMLRAAMIAVACCMCSCSIKFPAARYTVNYDYSEVENYNTPFATSTCTP